MRAIMVMFDSLRKDVVDGSGKERVELPNFKRLKEKTISFENNYACSLPCMPARRELHTGRANFLHRAWGPLEPFDDSMPELLKHAGIHSHLSTDHYHYFEDGGATYHNRYSTWAGFRGQENDPWIGDCNHEENGYADILMHHDHQREPLKSDRLKSGWQNVYNRSARKGEEEYSQTLTFDDGIAFMERNKDADNWFLQIEAFDPHEPFDSPEGFLKNWFDPDDMSPMDWPPYARVDETEKEISSMRKKYFSLVQFCDFNLGRVLDFMDANGMWEDTMLIVNTDHGFSLGEHDWWGKNHVLDYQEIVHTPLYIWDPRYRVAGENRGQLVQTIDLAPTILEFFGVSVPETMLGKPLGGVVQEGMKIRKYGIFGYCGSVINVTDGRYVYMRTVRMPEKPLTECTLMPTRLHGFMSDGELKGARLSNKYGFTKGYPVLEVPAMARVGKGKLTKDLLFDLWQDPGQEHPIVDETVEARMCGALVRIMRENEAPEDLYQRFGLD